jgi:hypothetical protein
MNAAGRSQRALKARQMTLCLFTKYFLGRGKKCIVLVVEYRWI